MADAVPKITCHNLRHFKETLKTLRQLDDKIVYKLNQSVPTESFKHEIDAEARCKGLYTELLTYYKMRQEGIQKCIVDKTEIIDNLREKVDKEDDHIVERQLKSHQSALRVIKSEMLVEEVVKARTLKIFNEKCWKAYEPPT